MTGILISADWMAGLGSGASTVSVPSGESEERTAEGSIPTGSLRKEAESEGGEVINPSRSCIFATVRMPERPT